MVVSINKIDIKFLHKSYSDIAILKPSHKSLVDLSDPVSRFLYTFKLGAKIFSPTY